MPRCRRCVLRPNCRRASARPPSGCAGACCGRASRRPPRRCTRPRATSTRAAADAEKAFAGEIDRYVYSRYGNPTIVDVRGAAAADRRCARLLRDGDRAWPRCSPRWVRCWRPVTDLVAARSLFGSCFVVCNEILPRWGIETVFVDGDDLSQWEEALSEPTQAVFFETPSNPMQSLVDIAAVMRNGAQCRRQSCPGQRVRPLRFCSRVFRLASTSWCTPAPSTSMARAGYRRCDPRRQDLHRRAGAEADAAHRSCAQPVQRMGVAEGPGDAGRAGAVQQRCGASRRAVPVRTIPP